MNSEKEVDGRSKSQDQEGPVYHWAKGSNILVCVSLRYMWGNKISRQPLESMIWQDCSKVQESALSQAAQVSLMRILSG